MSDRLVDVLNTLNPNDEALEIAARAVLSEMTGDKTRDEMRTEVASAAGGVQDLDQLIRRLSGAPDERRDAALAFLSWAWENPDNRPAIRGALQGARGKLPAIEVGILAIAAMYAMYLIATGGKKEMHVIRKEENGRFVEEKSVVFASVLDPIRAIVEVISGIRKHD